LIPVTTLRLSKDHLTHFTQTINLFTRVFLPGTVSHHLTLHYQPLRFLQQ